MSVYVNNKYRIKRNANYQETMIKLRDAKIFADYKDMLMVSAIIGLQNNLYVPIEKPASDGVLMQFFTEKDYDIFDFIAFSHKKDQSIIRSDDKYEIFEAYANGGFPVLLQKLEINNKDDISEDDSKRILISYYKLLLTNDLYLDDSANDEDLFI